MDRRSRKINHRLKNATFNDWYYFFDTIKHYDLPDKTLLFKEVLNNNFKKILITAPNEFKIRHYMSLFKLFLQTQETENKLILMDNNFFNIHNLEIYQDQEFFQQHFQTYPVIKISLRGLFAFNFDEMVDNFRHILLRSFMEHSYLLKSSKLDAEEINKFKKYYDQNLWEMLMKIEIIEGFAFLSELLWKHFNGKKVFVLLPDYDTIITENIFCTRMRNFSHFYDLYSKIITNTLNSQFVGKALITGVHYFDVLRSLDVDGDFQTYLFPHEHQFTKYIGYTESEMDDVFLNKLKMKRKRYKKFKKFYDCYANVTKQTKMFTLKTFLNISNCHPKVDPPLFLRFFYTSTIPIIQYTLEKLYLNQTLIIEKIEKLTMEHANELYAMYLKCFVIKKPDVFLNCLIQLGYLTYEPITDSNLIKIKLLSPFNKALRHKLCKYCTTDSDLLWCTLIFNKIYFDWNDRIFRLFLNEFKILLNTLQFKSPLDLHYLMFYILCKTDFVIGDEGLTFTNGKPDLIFFKDNVGVIVNVTFGQCAVTALEESVIKYGTVFYEKSCFSHIDEILFFGLNVNVNGTASMGVYTPNLNTMSWF